MSGSRAGASDKFTAVLRDADGRIISGSEPEHAHLRHTAHHEHVRAKSRFHAVCREHPEGPVLWEDYS